MNLIAQRACDLMRKGSSFILSTIVSHNGSTPRSAGSQMIITSDGRDFGTIGGGLMEAKVVSQAMKLITQGRSAIIPFDMSFESVDSMDMICGGQADVLLDCIQPTSANQAVFDRWRMLVNNGEKGWLLSIVAGAGGTVKHIGHCLLLAGGTKIGDWPLSGTEQAEIIAANPNSSKVGIQYFEDAFVVVVPVQRVCTTHLFGAGHVSYFTAKAAETVGFRVVVADDRDEYANAERFPGAHEIRVLESFDQVFAGRVIDNNDYIVILTRGHLHDRIVLAQALRTDAGYIGMIGSCQKRDAIYKTLMENGFSQQDIQRVHSPIGISIGAETPEEIAVSIVAELVSVRAAFMGI